MATSKTGRTDRLALVTTAHVADVPVQSPGVPGSPLTSRSQPAKVNPASGFAVSVTEVPDANVAQVAPAVEPQSVPAGATATFPEPTPDLNTRKFSDLAERHNPET